MPNKKEQKEEVKETTKETIKEIVKETNKEQAQKRPRGRPKKQPTDSNIVNENKKSVTMSSQSSQSSQSQSQANEEKFTIQALNQRWRNIFNANQNKNFAEIMSVWQSTMGVINNPFIQNQRIKQINAQARNATKEELKDALMNPTNNESLLQQISFGLYFTNYFYNQLVRIDRNTPCYNWYVLPQNLDEKDMKTELFKKESVKADKIMKAFKPSLTFKTIATQVAIEGKSAYLPRYSMSENGNVDFFLLQKLNSNEIKLTGFGSEQQFICSFNMIIFLQPQYNVNQYPPFIRQVWEEMLNCEMIYEDEKGEKKLNPKIENLPGNGTLEWDSKTWAYWVQLPQDLCYVFYSDGSHPNCFPDTIGMFDDFNDLDNYKWLQASLMSKGVNSILTAEVPYIKDPKAGSDSTACSADTVLGYTDLFTQSVSGNILGFFAPFQNFALHGVESQPEALDIIYDRTRDLIASTGNASLLPITDKPSIASVVTARKLQAAKVDYLTRQFEEFLNNMFEKEFKFKFEWRVSLWGDIFSKDDDIKQLKEMVNNGYEAFLPKLLSAFNYSVEDYRNAKVYLDTLGIKPYKSFEIDKMKLQADLNEKLQTKAINMQNQIKIEEDKTGEKKKVGRPMIDNDSDMSDATEASRNNGQDSEQKEASEMS